MVTKEILKSEIDMLPQKYFDLVHRIIISLELNVQADDKGKIDWEKFIDNTAGCLSADPICRGPQGKHENREELI